MRLCCYVLFVVLALACTVNASNAQSTGFTYQGALSDESGPATGLFDMTFGLFPDNIGGTAVSTVTNTSVEVVEGLFTTMLDFGAAVFDGTDYWLEIGVQADGGGGFTTLEPRQALNSVPYAIHAQMAMDVVNPMFLGTTTDAPLELFVNNAGAFRLEPSTGSLDTANVIGGSPHNMVGDHVHGATIGGGGSEEPPEGALGGANVVGASFSTVGGGARNQVVFGEGATIGGGTGNMIDDFVGGRTSDTASWSVIGGGVGNSIIGGDIYTDLYGGYSTIGGGAANRIMSSNGAVVSGGIGNTNRSSYGGTVGGGWANGLFGGLGSTIGGGAYNVINFSNDSTISGGYRNEIGIGSYGAIISGGSQNNIGADAEGATIGGGVSNTNVASAATVSGGRHNKAFDSAAVIGGGQGNVIQLGGAYSTIAGGENNEINGLSSGFATIGGGSGNQMANEGDGGGAFGATIAGGMDNYIGYGEGTRGWFCFSTISGGSHNEIVDGSSHATISGGWSNTIELTSQATISGGYNNIIREGGSHATIGGGNYNTNGAGWGTISGGGGNTIAMEALGATIGGGISNMASNQYSIVSGGGFNQAIGYGSVVAGGGGLAEDEEEAPNKAEGRWSSVGGGGINTAAGNQSTVSGGSYNVARGESATIPGGFGNIADGDFSFAAGWNAQAKHEGSFVWADNSPFTISSSTNREFLIRATGGVRFVTGIDMDGNPTSGVSVPAGGTGWDVISDRNIKENFEPVDGKEVLDQVAAMPISRWNMKSQDPSIRHIGPMAQDFHAAFGLGESDRRINTVDADGVALAAIQGLNQKLEEQLQDKDDRIRELEHTVSEMKVLMEQMARRMAD